MKHIYNLTKVILKDDGEIENDPIGTFTNIKTFIETIKYSFKENEKLYTYDIKLERTEFNRQDILNFFKKRCHIFSFFTEKDNIMYSLKKERTNPVLVRT